MQIRVEEWSNSIVFVVLSIGFFLFYAPQIPTHTSNADVLVYSCRASADSPILTYAFLDDRYLELYGLAALPNYHVAHTAILWVAYHAVPEGLREGIWLSGLVSSLSGAFTVGLSFLIWMYLGIRREVAVTASIVAGFVPVMFYSNLIGEVHSVQLCMTLLFIYFFIKHKLFFAIGSFLVANLVTPLAGLSALGCFLSVRDKNALLKMILVGLVALVCYFAIYWLIGSEILKIFSLDVGAKGDRSFLWRIFKLGKIVCLNMHFLLPFLIWGGVIVWKERRELFYGLMIGLAPHVAMIFLWGSQVLTENGSSLLFVFWLLSLPVGMALCRIRRKLYIIPLIAVMSFLGTHGLFVIPGKKDGMERYQIGRQLGMQMGQEVKIFGHWNPSIGLTLGKVGWNFDKLSGSYVEFITPLEEMLMKSGEESAIVAQFLYARPNLSGWYRRLLSKEKKGETAEDVLKGFKESLLAPLYESKYMRVYAWKKPTH